MMFSGITFQSFFNKYQSIIFKYQGTLKGGEINSKGKHP